MAESFTYSQDTRRPIANIANALTSFGSGAQIGLTASERQTLTPLVPRDGIIVDFALDKEGKLQRDWLCSIYPQIDPQTHTLIEDRIQSLASAGHTFIEELLTPIPESILQPSSVLQRPTTIANQLVGALPYLLVSGMVGQIAIYTPNADHIIPDIPGKMGRRKVTVQWSIGQLFPNPVAKLFDDQHVEICLELDPTHNGKALISKELAKIIEEENFDLNHRSERRIRSWVDLKLKFVPNDKPDIALAS